MTYELAPVYDLGSCLFSKRSNSLATQRLDDAGHVDQDAFGTNVSCYRLPTEDGKSEAIHPFEYMTRTQNPDLKRAMNDIADKVDLDEFDALVDDIPQEAFGRLILPDGLRESHKKLVRTRFETGLLPLL